MESEITAYLLEEEFVPVVFLVECPRLGFLVNPDQGNADIPESFRASLPFWIAKQLYQLKVVKIESPKWLKEMGPGVTINSEKSYAFSSDLSVCVGDPKGIKRIADLIVERIPLVMNSCLTTKARTLERKDDRILFIEEREMIKKAQESIEEYNDWKSNTKHRV